MKKHTRSRLLATTFIAGVTWAASLPAVAQSTQLPGVTVQGQADQDATEIGEVVVTGSRIRRDPTNAPTPLITVDRETLLATGQSTVIDYLATIPALQNSVVPSDTTGSNLGDGGLSLPNLRSLGSGRTLTLVDGRRHVGSNGGSLAVDIDVIPRLLIENIEIVTGGASSVYGADAVSGVLNFVLRKDFEGLEIDANYGMINQDGQANKRISLLAGANLLDDRLNVYAFGEYEDIDEVQVLDIDWLESAYGLIGLDADPATLPYDGVIDAGLFSGLRTLQRPRWGQTTLANMQQPSALLDPDVPLTNCNTTSGTGFRSANCFSVDPTKTYVFDGTTARLANFGQRVGNTGANRPNNIGGDGDNASQFGQISRVPSSESSRFQVGANYRVTDNIRAVVEAKYVNEDTFDISQPVFYDFIISDRSPNTNIQPAYNGFNQFGLRLSDNAFLPANLRTAIQTNMLTPYADGTPNAPGVAGTPVSAAFARHTLFGPNRTQDNNRELSRFVAGLNGDLDQVSFVKNISWDLSYVYGQVDVRNTEGGTDNLRFLLASDAVVDTAGVLGTPGAIVCRARILQAQGQPLRDDFFGGADLRDTKNGRDSISSCVPLNVFGQGNQSAAALSYIDAAINVRERNEQEQAIASISGQLWDFFGAGPIGVAVGAEYRREYTEAVGRDADTAGRSLFLNTGPDFPGAEYTSDEFFAELSVPLFQDSWAGEYAEISGSYRTADYSHVGKTDVYGVNFVYRPIQDLAFKTSFNTSVRVPNLSENFGPFGQTFANAFVDPCATLNINSPNLAADIRANRIANCTAQAQAKGLTFDFAGATLTNVDDFNPNYGSGVAGVTGGNPFLKPEESESFTFSMVLEPRFVPNLSIVLDYYEIEITDVIAEVLAQVAANNCVSGPSLNNAACDTIFRNNPGIPFGLGAPLNDPIGGFIEGSINYAKLQTRGLDFTARYQFDTEEMLNRNWGRFDYSIRGLWLLEQKQFLDSTNAANFVEQSSLQIGSQVWPRVRFSSSLTWTPNDTWSVNWTADFQTASDSILPRNFVLNPDSRPTEFLNTGNFTRHDFTVRYNVADDLSMRFGVVNAFDQEQARYLGSNQISNFDSFGTRFFIGLNYRPF